MMPRGSGSAIVARQRVKHWEIIAENLSKAGFSLGCLKVMPSDRAVRRHRTPSIFFFPSLPPYIKSSTPPGSFRFPAQHTNGRLSQDPPRRFSDSGPLRESPFLVDGFRDPP